MRSFPPIREAYRGFDVWARQFKNRRAAENYIKERNRGIREGRVDKTQSKLLDYNFGAFRYSVSHGTTKTGRSFAVLHKQTTTEVTIGTKVYKAGWFIPLEKDERDPEFKRLTIAMTDEEKEHEKEREERRQRK